MQSIVRQLLLFISCLLLLLSVVQAAPVRPPPFVTTSANSLTNCLDQRCAIVYISIYTLKRFQVASPEALEKRVAEPIADALARRIPVRPVQSNPIQSNPRPRRCCHHHHISSRFHSIQHFIIANHHSSTLSCLRRSKRTLIADACL